MEVHHWDSKTLHKLADNGLGDIEYGGTAFGGLPYLRLHGSVAKLCRDAIQRGETTETGLAAYLAARVKEARAPLKASRSGQSTRHRSARQRK